MLTASGSWSCKGSPRPVQAISRPPVASGGQEGGIVVTFFRASRPRDLNHYEFFTTYHSAIYRHVEPVTVNPFAPTGTRPRARVPCPVAILRQAAGIIRRTGIGSGGSRAMEGSAATDPRQLALPRQRDGRLPAHECGGDGPSRVMEERAQQQPVSRRPGVARHRDDAAAELDCWQQLAARVGGRSSTRSRRWSIRQAGLLFSGILPTSWPALGQAYEDAPNSLREVESTTTFRGWYVPPGRPHQEIRPSQFVITYGPGTILETRSGPVVIKSMDEMFRLINEDPQQYEIVDPRLSRTELNGARIARLPTNDEMQIPVDEEIYPTERLPYWALCTRHNPQILYSSSRGCSQCPPMNSSARQEKAGREAIRFVMACEAGHLDEVNWHLVVHGPGVACRPDYYLWHGGGRALRFVELECPRCSAPQANMGQAYGRHWPCSCRLPELGPAPAGVRCPRNNGNGARMMQRGAANLRMTVLAAALTILDMPGRLHNVLTDQRNTHGGEFAPVNGVARSG